MQKTQELKAQVYDLLVELGQHQLAIKELQKKVQEVNADIAKRKKELLKVEGT